MLHNGLPSFGLYVTKPQKPVFSDSGIKGLFSTITETYNKWITTLFSKFLIECKLKWLQFIETTIYMKTVIKSIYWDGGGGESYYTYILNYNKSLKY